MSYYSSQYLHSDATPDWSYISNLAGDIRQFIDAVKYLDSAGSISSSDMTKKAESVIHGDAYTDDEKVMAAGYLDRRKELVDDRLQGVDYSTLAVLATRLWQDIQIWESFGLRNSNIKELDVQYDKKAKELRAIIEAKAYAKQQAELAEQQAKEQAKQQAEEQAAQQAREQAERQAREQAERWAKEQAERQAREQAERKRLEKELDERLNKSFRAASLMIERTFDDANVARSSCRDNYTKENGTEHKLRLPIWMFNDDANRCYCVYAQRGTGKYRHEWFYSVMRSCDVRPTASCRYYSKGVTSGKHYLVRALSPDFKTVLPVTMKSGRVIFNDKLLSICLDDREVQFPKSLEDIDVDRLGDVIAEECLEEHDAEESDVD